MRKFLLAIVILSIASCTKGFDAKNESETHPKKYTYTVTANSPSYELSADSKADMGAVARVFWTVGDPISVIDVNNHKYIGDLTVKSVSASGVATFQGDISSEITASDNIAYIYPKLPSEQYTAGVTTFNSYEQSLAAQSYNGSTPRATLCAYAKKASGVSTTLTLNFSLATSYVNLNLSNLPSNMAINKLVITNINGALVWKIDESGAFVLDAPTTTNNGITVTISNATTSSSGNITLRFAVPQSASTTSRTIEINDSYRSSYINSARDAGQFYNQIFSSFSALFSVSADKKVIFSKGNLYWDRDIHIWGFEAQQYNYPSKDDVFHEGFFYWSKTEWVATTSPYNDPDASESDILFTNDPKDETKPNQELTVNGQTGVWRALSKPEWQYLLTERANASSLFKNNVTVCGKTKCLIIAPDKYTGTLKEEYTEIEWPKYEADGLVCLPATENIGSVKYPCMTGEYWASTGHGDTGCARALCFHYDEITNYVGVYDLNRYRRIPIRLVRE